MDEEPQPTSRRVAKYIAAGVAAPILAGIGALAWDPLREFVIGATSDPVETSVSADVGVLSNPDEWSAGSPNWDPYFYYLPVGAAELTAPPTDCRQRRPWAQDLDGADADETRLKLTITGNRDGEVSIDSMNVTISQKSLPAGIVAACPVGGASREAHGFVIDLDQGTVVFQKQGEKTPARFTLRKGETERFDIYAYAFTQPTLYEWRLSLEVVDGDDRRSVVVDDNGAPFRTAGTAAAGTAMVEWKEGAWRPYSPGGS